MKAIADAGVGVGDTGYWGDAICTESNPFRYKQT